jgi:hypothetical protein
MTLETLKSDLKKYANIYFKLIRIRFIKYFTLLYKFIKTYKLLKKWQQMSLKYKIKELQIFIL